MLYQDYIQEFCFFFEGEGVQNMYIVILLNLGLLITNNLLLGAIIIF